MRPILMVRSSNPTLLTSMSIIDANMSIHTIICRIIDALIELIQRLELHVLFEEDPAPNELRNHLDRGNINPAKLGCIGGRIGSNT